MRPRIGVTCAATPGAHYQQALDACGAEVVALPPGAPETAAAQRDPAAADLHGILFTGGVDVAPRHYGVEAVHPATEVDPARDAAELPLAAAALRAGIPVLGICRGMQLLNVAAGGTLWQDLPSECPSDIVHMEPAEQRDRTRLLHPVTVAAGTRLAGIVGATELAVNSIHHQAVRQPAARLAVAARAPDGVVEALEGTGPGFLLMVQWHPEDLWGLAPRHEALFSAFVAAAKAAAQ